MDAQMQHRIRGLREYFGLAPSDLAAVTGLPLARVQALETGQEAPSLDDLLAFGDAFGVSVEWLLGRGGNRWGPGLQEARSLLIDHLKGLSGPPLIHLMGATTSERIAYVVERMRSYNAALMQDWYIAGWLGLSEASTARILRAELDATTPVIARLGEMTGLSEVWIRTGDPKTLP